ncbi:MAG TPA: DUF5694 domain-containing protein [Chitinophagaceae bacterium]|nr:DUF5694 domain-containing protein [Chitinophagaceae bacterium]
MKFLILSALWLLHSYIAISQSQKAEELQILLIGTSHQAGAKTKQDTSAIMSAVRIFQPDAIAVEIIPAWDTLSLRNSRSKFIYLSDSILKANKWGKEFLYERINALNTEISLQPGRPPLYDSLAFYYLLTGDVYGNSAYNWFIAKKISENNPLWQSLFSKTPFYKWTENFLQGSEFNTLIFPFAFQANYKYLYPVDDMSEALLAKEYQKKTMNSLVFGILKLNFKAFKVLRMLKRQKKEYAEAEKKGKAYELVNTEKFQQQVAELFDNIYPKWSQSKWAKLVQLNWNQRNDRIAKRIISISHQNPKIKKIVLFIGAAHLTALKRTLYKAEKISVNTLNNIKK